MNSVVAQLLSQNISLSLLATFMLTTSFNVGRYLSKQEKDINLFIASICDKTMIPQLLFGLLISIVLTPLSNGMLRGLIFSLCCICLVLAGIKAERFLHYISNKINPLKKYKPKINTSYLAIPRKQLLERLNDYVRRGSGVIVGSPGVGKTYLFSLAMEKLKKTEKVATYYFPLEELSSGKIDAIRTMIGKDSDGTIAHLKTFKKKNKQRNVIIFDAYDAVRNDTHQYEFISLIRDLTEGISDQWSIIVSVRTYDAQKSHELLDLFPKNSDENIEDTYQDKSISCRHFKIPELNSDEIKDALRQIEAETKIILGISKKIIYFPF